jgi:arrestin-related trafficking adapter 3/6
MATATVPQRATSYRSSTHGTLYYYASADLTNSSEKPRALFRPRRAGPGRIRIQPVVDPDLGPPPKPPKPKRQLSVKLAVTRENARRFLKSVIYHPNNPTTVDTTGSNNPAQQAKQEAGNKWKRRSWSLATWSISGDVQPSPPTAQEVSAMRGNIRASIGGPVNAHLHRPRLNSDGRNTSTISGHSSLSNGTSASPNLEATVVDSFVPSLDGQEEKPVASGNGVSISIHLAEPVLFLQGFENAENSPGNTAMLRGSLHMRVTKPAKIKAVSLRFKGKAVTKWPEGIPPRKVEFDETDTIMNHTWTFWSTQFPDADHNTGASHVQLFKTAEGGASTSVTRLDPLGRSSPHGSAVNLTAKEAKKLSLQVNQSRSFSKNEAPPGGNSVAAKGYRNFLPGDYIYNFELPLDSRLPETIDVELGSVRYELEAEITRAGAFRANLVGNKEVTLIRAPAEGSLEQVEPIAISRNWEDQLHYDIVISGKSFPLGSQVPIAFKLTPLAKVQCHRIKVLITENIEYFCSNKKVHRMEPARKVQLFEKRSDSPPTSTFPGSTMRVTAGGGIPYDARARAARGEDVTPTDTSNLLGNLEGDSNIGPTEMEFNVQLPSCHNMKDRDRSQRLHFDTTYQNIQVHHWIKVSVSVHVLRCFSG